MDVLLLAVAARLAIGPGVRTPAYHLLGLSLVSLLVADCVYTLALLDGTSHTGYPGDAGWLLSYLPSGAAALHPSMVRLTRRRRSRRSSSPGSGLALLAGASLTRPPCASFRPCAARSRRGLHRP